MRGRAYFCTLAEAKKFYNNVCRLNLFSVDLYHLSVYGYSVWWGHL